FAHSIAQLEQRKRVVHHKIRMHLERDAMNSVFTRELRRLLPVWDHFLFPLPVESCGILRRPAIGYPVRIRVARIAARTARKTDNDFHPNPLREQHCFLERFPVALRDVAIGMNWIAVTAQGCNLNVVVRKFLLPRAQLDGIVEQFRNRTLYARREERNQRRKELLTKNPKPPSSGGFGFVG